MASPLFISLFFYSFLKPKQKSLPTVWPGGIRGLGADRGSRGEENLRSLEPADFPIRFREPDFSTFLPGGPPTLRGDSGVGPRGAALVSGSPAPFQRGVAVMLRGPPQPPWGLWLPGAHTQPSLWIRKGGDGKAGE